MAFTISASETNLYKIVQAILGLLRGQTNTIGYVTLRANQVTTVVTTTTDPAAANAGVDSEVFYSAKNAHAAAVAWSIYTTGQARGTFTVNHASSANNDLTFAFEIRNRG